MEAFLKCPHCLGNKTHAPLGGISKACNDCKGTGYLTLKDSNVELGSAPFKNALLVSEVGETILPIDSNVLKKRGRPKSV